MYRFLQKSNLPAYIFIIIGAKTTSMILNIFFDQLTSLMIFIIYNVLVLFVLNERIMCYLYKIKYNLPPTDLKRVQKILSQVVSVSIKKGNHVPTSYRIGYINDPQSCQMIAYASNKIAVSRLILDHFTDEELSALFAHELGRIYYGLPFLDLYVLTSNIAIMIVFMIYTILISLIQIVVFKLNGAVGKVLSGFFIGKPVLIHVLIQKLKEATELQNLFKCDKFVCDLGMKQGLLKALSKLIYPSKGRQRYLLNERIFYVK